MGITAIQQLGRQNNFTAEATEDATQFNDANLARFKAVIWLPTTGDVLDGRSSTAGPADQVQLRPMVLTELPW